MVITETWLNDNDNNAMWMETSDLNAHPYVFHNGLSRSTSRGGGVALIIKENIKVSRRNYGLCRSFEHATWTLTLGSKTITVTCIYHPLPKDHVTNAMFIDDFTQYQTDLLQSSKNNIITGDFNMQIEDPTNTDVVIFNDTLCAFGLTQHVTHATHVYGNILDLMSTELNTRIQVIQCKTEPLISDHKLVLCTFNVPKPHITWKTITTRKTACLTDEQLNSMFDPGNVDLTYNLDQIITDLDTELKCVMNQFAPEKTVTISSHPKQPWYDETVKEQHKILRWHERVWTKYQQDHKWITYKKECTTYNNLLIYKKRQILSKQVNEAKGNTKKMYKLMDSLTWKHDDSSLPNHDSEAKLAE